ncbi:MAG TPA: DUF6496 domain-containing protein [Burkholderiales bacterium]|nr:DUF6496 domain-containing protein [Burkholderiales bacterium]
MYWHRRSALPDVHLRVDNHHGLFSPGSERAHYTARRDCANEGDRRARSTEQAIAIGLSKARRAGVKLPPPKKGTTSKKTRQRAERDYEAGKKASKPTSRTRARKRR